ncbi:MAG: hypothetical protein HY231_25735 [Acidobacteria bacterium]|nr:hypothetical protein [Acidobacteriota bacterium]
MFSLLLICGLLLQGGEVQPTDVQVVKYGFRYSTYGTVDNRASFVANFKNLGKRTVTAINWQFVFFDSIRGDRVVDVISFRTDDKPIKAGSQRGYGKRIDYGALPNHIKGYAIIDRVEYADGSFWQRPKPD